MISKPLYGRDLLPFRFFTSLDGLKESWVSSLTVGPTGTVWINHGAVDEMSVFDGYRFRMIASPGPSVKVIETDAQAIWTLKVGTPGGFKRYVQGRWVDYDLPDSLSNRSFGSQVPFLPQSQNRILYLLPDALMQFDTTDRSVHLIKSASECGLGSFLSMVKSFREGVWISGEKGVARLREATSSKESSRETLSSIPWEEFPIPSSLRVTHLRRPLEGNRGELFLVGTQIDSGNDVLLHFDGLHWDRPSIPWSGNVLTGWRGHDESVWGITGSPDNWELVRFASGHMEVIEKNRIFSGRFLDIAVEPRHVFWIGTSMGLTRYAPLAWRSPVDWVEFRDPVGAMCQDSKGRLWFLSQSNLILLQERTWKKYPFPEGASNDLYVNNELISLPDGRIVTIHENGAFLQFYPEEERFEILSLPDNRAILFMTPRKEGGVFLLTADIQGAIRLEIHDGQNSTILYEPIDLQDIGNIRSMLQTDRGDIWLGGLKGIALIREGTFQTYTPDEGYIGYGAFCIAEMHDHQIWIGGRDSIYAYDGQSWTNVGLTNLETVRAILQGRDGRIWVASGSGVHCFQDGVWISNTFEDGLPDAAVMSLFEDNQEQIWAGTLLGLSRYHPRRDRYFPETYIQSDRNLVVTPPGGEVRLFYEGIDRWRQTTKDRLLYSFRLDDQAWSSYTSSTVFSASHLNSGSHRFEVRAMDRNWNVDPQPAAFEFTVLLPWYRTPGFLVVLIIGTTIILLLLFYAVSRYFWMEKLVEERSLQLSKRQAIYQTLVENLPQYIFLKDVHFQFISVNSSFCQLIDRPLSQILGQTDFDLYPEALAQKYRRDDQRILDSGKGIQSIEENETHDGRKWVEVVKTPVKDAKGEITGILGIFWDITGRVQIEEALRKNQELLEATQRVAHVGSWDSDLLTGELVWSEETYRIFGYDRNEFDEKTETFFSYIYPDDRSFVQKASEQAIRETGLYKIDHRIICRDGSVRWVHEQAEVLVNPVGIPVHLVGTVQDITERKLVEQQLKESEERFRLLAENVPGVIYLCQNNYRFTMIYLNDEMEKLTGYPKEDFLQDRISLTELFHPDDQAEIFAQINRGVEKKRPFHLLYRVQHANGEWRYVQEVGVGIFDGDQLLFLEGFMSDVTEQKRAEDAIRNLAKFPEENPNPVLRVTVEGILLFANQPSAPLLDDWAVGVGQSLPQAWRERIQEVYASGNYREIELACGKRSFLIGLTPIAGEAYVNLYAVDVTEKKRLEEQFRQAHKMEAIGHLAGGVAHDFNNLIMAIQGYAQLIQRKLMEGDPMREDVNEILKASDRAASLTRQLLAFSRKQILQPEPLDLNHLIVEMEKMLRRLIGENIELSIQLQSDLGIVKADPGQIEQIILNLSVNARDAMPQGGRLILETSNVDVDENYIQEHVSVEPGPYILLAVSDNGCGMDKDTLAQVFDPFFSTKEVGKGTGLGLSTVYGIVKQSGGHIWVYSEPGIGTSFKLYFPRIDEKPKAGTEAQVVDESQTGKETILLVEDEQIVRNLVARILSESGYEVIEATNGHDAIRICEERRQPIHLIVTDVIMPKMSGAAMAQEITKKYPDIKVLFMSGYTDHEINHQGILDQDIDFIQKPFATNRLREKIRTILDR